MYHIMSVIRGFCRNKQFLESLQECGVSAKHIYLDGRGAEDFDKCVSSFRGQPGRLMVAPDLRVFGNTKQKVSETMAMLEKAKIKVVDIIHPQDGTISEQLHRANVMISGARFKDKRKARKFGRVGGTVKGESLKRARDTEVPEYLVRAIVNDRRIPWKAKTDVLGPKFPESTLRRHYLDRGVRK